MVKIIPKVIDRRQLIRNMRERVYELDSYGKLNIPQIIRNVSFITIYKYVDIKVYFFDERVL